MTTDVGRSTETWRQISNLIIQMAPVQPESWSPDTHLINDLGYDSVTAISLVFEVERLFETGPAPDDIALTVETVGALADCLAEHVAAAREP